MKDVLAYLQVPSQVEASLVNTSSFDEITLLNYTGMSVFEARRQAELQGVTVTVVGTGNHVYSQLPLANTRMLRGDNIAIYTRLPRDLETVAQVSVPELTGLTYEKILAIAEESGLRFDVSGQGVVVSQRPYPGAMVDVGSTVVVGLEAPVIGVSVDMAGP
jgi:stage V sporulation protein D (sporulation-specific penicillin-binding protein)